MIWSLITFLVCNNYNLYRKLSDFTIIIFLITLELSVM